MRTTMTISAKDILNNPKRLEEIRMPSKKCKCGVKLQKTITGRNITSEGVLCDDCYWEKFGELIEKSPVATARVRRG